MKAIEDYSKEHQKQKDFFYTHNTKQVDFRLRQLKNLKKAIKANEQNIMDALKEDLHKSNFEAYATEIGIVLEELSMHIKHLKKWAKPQQAKTNLVNFKSESYLRPEPYGQVLIIAPWNYPFQLMFTPLVGAIATGNTVTLKSSPYAPAVSAVMKSIIQDTFDSAYINFYEGNRDVNKILLDQKWDYIFFTGSPSLGKIIMREAAKNLTPVALELGGKSPTIVCKDADIKLAAKRVAWGKYLNAGQTCLAPDYLLIQKEVKDEFLSYMKQYIQEFYGTNPQQSPDYGRVVNKANVDRLELLMKNQDVYTGGKVDRDDRYIAPTILNNISGDELVMQEEIFGPIFPVVQFEKVSEAVQFVNDRPKPLALYLFSKSKKTHETFLDRTSSGGVCINEVVMHVANDNLPFGGVGNSGMGVYHGKFSFETFSHYKPVLKKSTLVDVPVRYAPYNGKIGLAKTLMS